MTNKPLHKAFSQLDITKKDKDYLIPAVLGFMINGRQAVDVPNRAGYVYARIRSNTNEVIQVFNDKVSPVYDLPVLLVRDPNNTTRYRVDGRDTGRYDNWGSTSSFLPRHGNQHSFNNAYAGAGDIVWVYGRQFTPLLLYPSGTLGADSLMINGYGAYRNERWLFCGNTGTPSFSPYTPTGSFSRMVLVSLDSNGNPVLTGGEYFSAAYTGVATLISYIPSPPSPTYLPLGAVLLSSGTSAIGWENIYDLRFFSGVGNVSPNTGSAGFEGIPIFEESTFKVTGTALHLTGNVDVVVSGTHAYANFGSGSSGGATGYYGTVINRVDVATGGYASFDVSGLTDEYDVINIYLYARSATAATSDSVLCSFNNDTTNANYHRQRLSGGSITAGADEADDRIIGAVPAGTSVGNVFGSLTANILKPGHPVGYKMIQARSTHITNDDNMSLYNMTLLWLTGGVINRITLTLSSGSTFVSGSSFWMVGDKEHI